MYKHGLIISFGPSNRILFAIVEIDLPLPSPLVALYSESHLLAGPERPFVFYKLFETF